LTVICSYRSAANEKEHSYPPRADGSELSQHRQSVS